MTAKEYISKLEMKEHPEGGWYKECYRAETKIEVSQGVRSVCTSIFYLLESGQKSHFHKIKSDELWYFHAGNSLTLYTIEKDKGLTRTILSTDNPFLVIKSNTWFAAQSELLEYCLVSCVVSPGFDFADFELAKFNELITEYGGDIEESDLKLIESLCIG